MSDTEKPNDQQTPPPPEQPRSLRQAARDQTRKSKPPPGKVQSLDEKDLSYGFGSKSDLFDQDLERDLERDLAEAMGDIAPADIGQLYGADAEQRKSSMAGQSGPRKGKVISVRGKDVFVDVGGRTQG